MTYRTCTQTYDTGGICNSAAVKNQNYCAFHLRHRAHLMRMAKARARNQRFYLNLPPLESLHAVQSALSQISQALSADMIDLKRADRIIHVLTVASRNLLKADKWPASSVFHSDQPSEINVAVEYGLPPDTNFDATPESAFSPPTESSSLSSRAERSGVEGPAFSGDSQPATGNFSDNRQPPTDNSDVFAPGHMVYPDTLEVAEIYEKVSPEAATVRARQLERNRHRRELTANRKRFEQMALRLNIRNAAERLAQKKLAEHAAHQGDPQSPDSGNCGSPSRKPPSPIPSDPKLSSQTDEKAALTPTG